MLILSDEHWKSKAYKPGNFNYNSESAHPQGLMTLHLWSTTENGTYFPVNFAYFPSNLSYFPGNRAYICGNVINKPTIIIAGNWFVVVYLLF